MRFKVLSIQLKKIINNKDQYKRYKRLIEIDTTKPGIVYTDRPTELH